MALFSTYAKIQQTNGFHRYLLDFFHKQDDKPGYVLNNHLSRRIVANSLKQPT